MGTSMKITGPNGDVLFDGSTEDFKKAVDRVKRGLDVPVLNRTKRAVATILKRAKPQPR